MSRTFLDAQKFLSRPPALGWVWARLRLPGPPGLARPGRLPRCTRPRAGPRRTSLSRLLAPPSRTSSRALASRLFPLGLARSGRPPRRTRPRAGPWRTPLPRLLAPPSLARSLALAPSRVFPRWLTSLLSRNDGPSLAAPGGGSGLVASPGRFGPG